MNNDPTASPDSRSPNEKIADALRNESYLSYAFDSERMFQPLFEDEVDGSVRGSGTFRSQIYGTDNPIEWPDQFDQSRVIPPYAYGSSAEFKAELFSANEIADALSDDGREYDANIIRKKQLNNLLSSFAAQPANLDANNQRVLTGDENLVDIVYGSNPALIRAYLIAPDLMTALHETFSHDMPYDEKRTLMEDDSTVAAVYMAYRIMGRLVKDGDAARQQRINGSDRPVDQAQDRLTFAHDTITR